MFVSNFIGTSNFIMSKVTDNNTLIIGDYVFDKQLKQHNHDEVMVSVRPEQFVFTSDRGIKGEITLATFLGDFISYEILLENGQTIEVNEFTQNSSGIRPEGPVSLLPVIEHIIVYDPSGAVKLNVE